MAIHKVAIDVVDMSIPIGNHRNLAVINQPNPCYGYQAAAREVAYLIQISSYYVYAAGTKTIINGDNFYDYFPEAKPGGGGSGGGGVTPEEVATMIANAIDSSVSTTSTNAVQNAAITNFVNSSIESSTGQFRGTFETKEEMDLVEGSKNDYAFLVVRNPDDTVNHYERYKWVIDTTVEPPVGSWEYEYDVNNSSFTAEQWASINSGVKSSDVAQIGTNQLEISKIKADLTKVGATFRGIFNTEQAMDAVAADKNDTAILQSTDANGNEIYSIYSRVEIPQVVPEGYTQLMYISSNGTQYIDTGVQAKRDLKSYIKFTRNSYSSGSYIGARDDNVRYELRYDNWSGRLYGDVGTANVDTSSAMSSTNEIVFEYPTITVNDTVFNIPTQSDFTIEKNIYLCASNGNSSKGIISLYECIIYDDDKTTELKHFYPCKNSSNVCGMYEIVEGVFYPDANGGNFTAGPQANGYWVAQYSIPNNLFSSSQFAALNSGIDSTKVAQIETNKNNILSTAVYGTCSTAADTAAKIVDVPSGFVLRAGCVIGVRFTNTNSASNVTLNVGNTGNKSIRFANSIYSGTRNLITGAAVYTIFYMYDGEYWNWMSAGYIPESMRADEASAGTATGGRLISPKVLSDAIDERTQPLKNNISSLTANGGGINKATINDGSGTGSITIPCDSITGQIIIKITEFTSTDTDSDTSVVQFIFIDDTASGVIETGRGNNLRATMNAVNPIKAIKLFASDNSAHSTGDTFTFSGLEVCSIDDDNLPYQPYAMSNTELTAKEQANENNISTLEEMNGAKNMLQYTLASLKSLNTTNWSWTDNVATFQDGSTFTVNDDMSITVNTTNTHTLIVFKLTNAYPLNKGNTVLTGCPSNGGLYKYKLSVADVGHDFGSGIAVDNMTSDKVVSVEVSGNIAANVTFKPMVVTDTIHNAGFTDYQPYAMTNAELTAKEIQNENDILSEQAKTTGMTAGGTDYITVNGIRVYVSSTAPTGARTGDLWIGG